MKAAAGKRKTKIEFKLQSNNSTTEAFATPLNYHERLKSTNFQIICPQYKYSKLNCPADIYTKMFFSGLPTAHDQLSVW